MRISDWSSDVCSSDLRDDPTAPRAEQVVVEADEKAHDAGLVLARHIDDRAIARDAGRPVVAGAVLEIEIIAIGKAGGRPDPPGPRAAFGWGERVDSPSDRGKVGRALPSRKRRDGDFPMAHYQDAGGRLKQA